MLPLRQLTCTSTRLQSSLQSTDLRDFVLPNFKVVLKSLCHLSWKKVDLSSDLIDAPRLWLLFDLLLPDEALVSSDLAGVRLGCDVLTGTTGCILAAVC